MKICSQEIQIKRRKLIFLTILVHISTFPQAETTTRTSKVTSNKETAHLPSSNSHNLNEGKQEYLLNELSERDESTNRSNSSSLVNTSQIDQSVDVKIYVNVSPNKLLTFKEKRKVRHDEEMNALAKIMHFDEPNNMTNFKSDSNNEYYVKKLQENAIENVIHDKKKYHIRHFRKKENHREITELVLERNGKINAHLKLPKDRISVHNNSIFLNYSYKNKPIRNHHKHDGANKDNSSDEPSKNTQNNKNKHLNSDSLKISNKDGGDDEIIEVPGAVAIMDINNNLKVESPKYVGEENPNTDYREDEYEHNKLDKKRDSFFSANAEEALLLAIPLSLLLTLILLSFAACCCYRHHHIQEDNRYHMTADYDDEEDGFEALQQTTTTTADVELSSPAACQTYPTKFIGQSG